MALVVNLGLCAVLLCPQLPPSQQLPVPAILLSLQSKRRKEQKLVDEETSSASLVASHTKMAEVRVLCLNAKENSSSTLYRLKQG